MAVNVAEISETENEESEQRGLYSADLERFPSQVSHTAIPTLVFMAGFAGAGKTTLAKRLMAKLEKDEWEVLHKDDFKLKRLSRGEDTEQAGWKAFEELFARTAQEVIGGGKSVIIDTCGYPAFILNDMLNIMRKHGRQIQVKVILCIADKETRTKRIYLRGSVFAPFDEELPAIPDDSDAPAYFQHLPSDRLNLDTTQPFCRYDRKVLKKALKYILANRQIQ
jgi:predicted kinase